MAAHIIITELKRDRACSYCNMSEYKDNFDNRLFYQLRNDKGNTFIITLCEMCARSLYNLLGETVETKVHTLVTAIKEFPEDVQSEVIDEVHTMIMRVDY